MTNLIQNHTLGGKKLNVSIVAVQYIKAMGQDTIKNNIVLKNAQPMREHPV